MHCVKCDKLWVLLNLISLMSEKQGGLPEIKINEGYVVSSNVCMEKHMPHFTAETTL